MVELWLVVEPQVNNTLYWAKKFFYSASFSVAELNEIRETQGGGGGAHVKILTGMLVLFFWV